MNYDSVANMDVDLEFSPRYLERLLEYFQRDSGLAAASGKVYRLERGRLIEEFMIDEMVAGQFKFYRREAFERIGGFVREVMRIKTIFFLIFSSFFCLFTYQARIIKINYLFIHEF